MNIIQDKQHQGADWEYLPDTNTLLEYLGRKDMIELSRCCKCYRAQLEQQVFENMSLKFWERDKKDINYEPNESYKTEKVLEFLETDLGTKLKFVKNLTLDFEIDCSFGLKLIKILPNIKALFLYGGEYAICGCCEQDSYLEEGLKTILKGMKRLEHIYLYAINDVIDEYSTEKPVFPKSIKSLKIGHINSDFYDDKDLLIYDTIDSSYINLYFLTIISNRMLQNLSSGMSNLQEVEIKAIYKLDNAKLKNFLKINPQLTKLNTDNIIYSEEIIKIILSFKYLKYWSISRGSYKEIDINNLPPNYSIKYFKIGSSMPSLLKLNLINTCKSLGTLELEIYGEFNNLNWSKFKRRINKLKLTYNHFTSKTIKEVDASRLFNIIHIVPEVYTQGDNINIDFTLNNYKIISSISRACIFKLINS